MTLADAYGDGFAEGEQKYIKKLTLLKAKYEKGCEHQCSEQCDSNTNGRIKCYDKWIVYFNCGQGRYCSSCKAKLSVIEEMK